jgi:hypothetical protein
MEIQVTNKEVTSTTIWLVLDLTIIQDGKEHELEVSVEYQNMPNFGSTEIHWAIVGGDDSFLNKDDLQNQLDDLIQEYVYENIGKM